MNIPEAVDKIISQSPFLEEALSDGLINVSSLARKIKPEVKTLTHKEVGESAIIMAINRRPVMRSVRISKGIRAFMNGLGDIIVRSGLSDHTFENSAGLGACQRRLMDEAAQEREVFFTFSRGVYETTIVSSGSLDPVIDRIFAGEKRISVKKGLSSVTLSLPKNNTEVSGVYYFILKSLAWAGINVAEVISTSNEISIVVADQDVHRAFAILMGLKRTGGG
jgi:hypothetical protein